MTKAELVKLVQDLWVAIENNDLDDQFFDLRTRVREATNKEQ